MKACEMWHIMEHLVKNGRPREIGKVLCQFASCPLIFLFQQLRRRETTDDARNDPEETIPTQINQNPDVASNLSQVKHSHENDISEPLLVISKQNNNTHVIKLGLRF